MGVVSFLFWLGEGKPLVSEGGGLAAGETWLGRGDR